jgi:hypothetical protein
MWLDRQHSRRTAPAFAVGLGVVIWVAASSGGQPLIGLLFLVVITLIGVGTLLGGDSETCVPCMDDFVARLAR